MIKQEDSFFRLPLLLVFTYSVRTLGKGMAPALLCLAILQ
jgi:hypothetical protein